MTIYWRFFLKYFVFSIGIVRLETAKVKRVGSIEVVEAETGFSKPRSKVKRLFILSKLLRVLKVSFNWVEQLERVTKALFYGDIFDIEYMLFSKNKGIRWNHKSKIFLNGLVDLLGLQQLKL